MKVKLLQYPSCPEQVVAAAAKLCYSSSDIDSLMDDLTEQKTSKFLNMLVDLGHESPWEHSVYTFSVEGVSRSLLAQLTRHRIASYTVKSQRYVKEGQFEFVTPPEIAGDEQAEQIYKKTMFEIQKNYNQLSEILAEKHYNSFISQGETEENARFKAEKKAIEDARFVLPNACETKLVMTMNARSLYNFFRHRCCDRAQWEIRGLAEKMLELVKDVAPTLFKNAGAPCVSGACTEGAMTCGKPKR